jgi:ParB family transcriptional regulator, chromosome partitioning protein
MMSDNLRDLAPEKIKRNSDNPRIFFRDEEMNTLTASIRRYGIQVPVTVYKEGSHYVLLDGERRWRCARKLNLPTVPALVKAKPSKLQNILLMFNIHALREQWDYLTIARKLPDVISLFEKENKQRRPTEVELSELTGLTRGQIRRCRYLLDLPDKYREMLEKELSLPKQLQKLSEDFFIEMERALKTVEHRVPDAIRDIDKARDALIAKFRNDVIGNITDFRMLSKIATSINNIGVQEAKARDTLRDIFDPKSKTSIEDVYAEHFEMRYDERKVLLSVDSIYEYLENSISEDTESDLSTDLVKKLTRLRSLIDKILRS